MAEDLDSLKCIISALLVAHRGRMTISEFTRVYKSEEGHPVPFENFGCTNVRQFLNKISDTVTLTRGSTGEDVIQAKVKQELKHIDQMVKQQKPSSTKPKIKHAMHRPPVRGKCGLLSILLKAPDGLEASELLDMYESRFAVKNCGDGGHIVKMLEEGFQHPMQNVGQSTPQITADELNAYPVQELPHCWTFSVAIGEVFSPSEFYVLITADGALTQLADLMAELDEFYNSASSDFYSVNIGDLKPGFVCAALYTNDGQPLWHRAVVKSVQAREVFVFYIDYGTVMPVKVADIRRLRSDFLEFPAQAIKASLSGVKPKNEQAWTPKAKERFLQLVRMGECSCSVVSKEEDVCFVELLMSDGSMEYSISEVLIYEEFAVSTIVTEAVAPGTSIETWTFSDGYTADIIVWNGQRYMSSMGVSKVFGWKDDLVSKKLSEKGIRVDGALLEKKCVPELHLEVLNELDINSGRKVVTEPSKLSASSSSKHPKNTAGSSKSVVDKFQSKLLEALMTSKQK
ncbi:hypothetical protein MTO96_001961 [Rhipicephalus appendiculatus]